MGILDWIRGSETKKKQQKNLPAPTPVAPHPTVNNKPIVSDIPPIRPKAGPSMHETVKPYDAPRPTSRVEPKKVMKPQSHRPKPPADLRHIFISSDEYSTVIKNANVVRSKLLETEERLQQLSAVRTAEEKELLRWQEQLVSLEKKLTYMEAVLEKAGEI